MRRAATHSFARLFGTIFAASAHATEADLRRLRAAKTAILDPEHRALAEEIFALVRDDRKLDEVEVAPARRALSRLLDLPSRRLPIALERALQHAVPRANADVRHYELSFDISRGRPVIPARARIRLAAKARNNLVFEVAPERLDIQEVRARGRRVPFEVVGERLNVRGPDATDIDIRYTVRPTEEPNGYGLIRDARTGTYSTFTWPYSTGALFPSNSSPSDGVTARVTVRTGPGRQLVGAGTAGTRPIHIDKLVPAYAIAFYAGTFTREKPVVSKSGVTVMVHGRGKSVRPDVRTAYQAAAAAAIDFFSEWLGPYAYGKRFSLVEVGGSLGCMENAGAAAMMIGAIQGRDEAREMAVHEAAHHWFGDNLRIRNSGEFWMSEGFTNYLTYRFFRHSDGDPAFHKLLDRGKRLVKVALRHRQHLLEGPCYCDVRELFTDIPYELGPWILRMMEVDVGTRRFDEMLAAWYRAHRFSAVDTKEFLLFAKCHTACDLDAIFDLWSRIDALPSFHDRSHVEGDRVHIDLRARTAVPRGLLIPLLIEGARGERKALAIDPRDAANVDAGFRVKRLSWDPERRVLADVE